MNYFIHGFKEDPKLISASLNAIPVDIDWTSPLSKSVFRADSDDIIIGFSMGAIIAYLIAIQYKCHLFACSMTNPNAYSREVWMTESKKDMPEENAIRQVDELLGLNLDLERLDQKRLKCFYGEKENLQGIIVSKSNNIIIPNTGHELSSDYINKINTEVRNMY